MPDFEELIREVCLTSYDHKFYDGTHSRMMVGDDDNASTAIAKTIYTWASKQQGYTDMVREVGELKAKVYTYEQVIANSNFKPVIPENDVKPKEMVADALSKVRDELITMLVEGNPINEFQQGYHEAVRQALDMVQRHMRGDSE